MSCTVIYQARCSQLWTVLSLKEARTRATAVQASKSRHNSKTKPLIAILPNLFFINYWDLPVLLISALSSKRLLRYALRTYTHTHTHTHTHTNEHTTVCLVVPPTPRHNNGLCGTVSKALRRSKKTAHTSWPPSNSLDHWSMTWSKAVVVDLPCWNPHCLLEEGKFLWGSQQVKGGDGAQAICSQLTAEK